MTPFQSYVPPALRPHRTALKASMAALTASGALVAAHAAETVALFPFDEPVGLYPSSVLNDAGPGQMMLVLGRGGSIVPGKFGNAFSTAAEAEGKFPKGSVTFGLTAVPPLPGRTVEPMN